MSSDHYRDQIHRFIHHLQELDSGERARLKRAAGRPLAEARDVLGLFYQLLPRGVPAGHEEIYFLIATLFPMADAGLGGDLGASLRRARLTKADPGLDRRVRILLDSDAGQLAFRLRQVVRLIQSRRASVNWSELLKDLLYWSHPDRFVQRRWARAYFGQ